MEMSCARISPVTSDDGQAPHCRCMSIGMDYDICRFCRKIEKSSMREVRKNLFVSMDEGADNHFQLRLNLSFIYYKNLVSMALIFCWSDVKM